MIMPSAACVSDTASFERVETCPRDGAPFVACRGCRICAFDARYTNEPLGYCAACGAGLTGEENACAACLHAALVEEASASVAARELSGGYSDALIVLTPASGVLAGSDDIEEQGRLLHEALLAEARPQVALWADGLDAA
jgi:hypothetical protein